MLTLVTANPAKYAPFVRDLERWRIAVEPPRQPLPELKCRSFAEALANKARAAAAMFGQPVLVDDAGLVLEAYRPFPGPLTSAVVPSLGVAGLERLLRGVTDRATMECHIGCWTDGGLRQWSGAVQGRIDASRQPRDGRMILSDLFVPDPPGVAGELPHRARALAELAKDVFDLHLSLAPAPAPGAESQACTGQPAYQCPFCTEFADAGLSLFGRMLGERLPARVVYEDEHFLVLPPLGEFIEGGLLLLAREHRPAFSHLRPELYERLERLVAAIGSVLAERWGVAPLVFEHGPGLGGTKGGCCVDHAHFNIFPARVAVGPQLAGRMSLGIGRLSGLARLRSAEFGYLFVQENDGSRRAYDGQDAPTQLVRRLVTTSLGLPDRWHWRDYPGTDELVATYHALKGRIRL